MKTFSYIPPQPILDEIGATFCQEKRVDVPEIADNDQPLEVRKFVRNLRNSREILCTGDSLSRSGLEEKKRTWIPAVGTPIAGRFH